MRRESVSKRTRESSVCTALIRLAALAACSVLTVAATPPLAVGPLPAAVDLDRIALQYRDYWQDHPRGQWLLRILPVRPTPSTLPQAESEPARLTARYCVQCHALPDPAMHGAERWAGIVERMLPRMRGEGNEGRLMREMMQGLAAPSATEVSAIKRYLEQHAQQPLPTEAAVPFRGDRGAPPRVPGRPALTAALISEEGLMFRAACTQCHELPDPARHRSDEWPAVVARMAQNMTWMNRVVGSVRDPREPQLDPERIVDFLQAFASDAPRAEPSSEENASPENARSLTPPPGRRQQ